MSNINKDLGMATAYAYAVSQGYEGTEEEFAELMASYASVAQEAGEARDEAEDARDLAISAKDTAVEAVEGFEDTVDTATATAVQTIQGEGSTQVTAVQDKGDEVLGSIPADYTQLSQNVTDLKSAIMQSQIDVIRLEVGSYNDPKGEGKKATNTRIRNISPISVSNINTLIMPTGYDAWIYRYDADFNALTAVGSWKNGVIDIKSNITSDTKFINIAIRNSSTPSADISSQLPTVQSGIAFYSDIDKHSFDIALNILLESGKYEESSSGQKGTSYARIRNTFLIPISTISEITLPSGYSAQVHEFGASENWINYNDRWITEIKVSDLGDNTRFIGLTIRKTSSPNSDIRSDIPTVQSGINVQLASKSMNQLSKSNYEFESGKYSESNNGIKVASNARIRNVDLLSLDYVSHVNLPSPYTMQVHYYDNSGNWLGYEIDWVSYFNASQSSRSAKYIGLTIRNENTPNADIRSEVSIVKNGIEIITVLKHELISDVYADVLESLKQVQRTKNTSKDNYLARNKPLVLFHFSDIHQEQQNLRDIVNFASENSTLIDDVICTGDMVGARFSNGMAWWDGVDGAENILLAIGNHDTMNAPTGYDDSQQATLEEVYAQYIEPYYENWDLASDPSSGITYYYKDYDDSKIRLIVLDCMLDNVDVDADAVQYTWFQSVLADAITNNLYVVVADHCFPPNSSFIASNWTNADYQSTDTYLDVKYANAVDAFIGNSGKFICWIEGHSHSDYYLNWVGSHGTQMAISVDAASRFNAEGFTDVNRLENDRSYNSANLIAFDTGAECIKVIKFGAKCNYKLIPRQTLVLGFDGSIIVQN